MKGIILAGGTGSRLYPITACYSKQLVAVYDKPLIYYPLTTLINMGINDILIVADKKSLEAYKLLFAKSKALELKILYALQEQPNGIAEAFIIGEKFIGNDNVCLILGDNIFYGYDMQQCKNVPLIFGLYVNEPSKYGVIQMQNNKVIKIIEKPKKYISNYVVPGCYIYTSDVVKIAKSLTPSARNELEITDINNIFLKDGLNVELLNNGAWFDCGNSESLLEASNFIASVEKRHGVKVGCYEEALWKQEFITNTQFQQYIDTMPTCEYKNYLMTFI